MSEQQPRTVVFDPSAHAALLQNGKTVLVEASELVIDSDTMYEEGGQILAQVKGSIKRLEDAKEQLLIPLRAVDKAIRNLFDPGITERKRVEASLKAKMIAYSDKKAAEAEAARRAAEEATRKEKERLEREAAAARAKAEQEAAAARKAAEEAEAARKAAEESGNKRAAAAAAAQAAKLAEQAEQKQEAGERQAAALQEQAALTSVHTFAPVTAAPKATGTGIRRPWKARVTNKELLLKAIAANFAAYGHLVDINDSALNKMAGAQQKGLEAVLPGLECYQDATMSSRAA